ncbi:MAG: cyclic nucleotide-binding domain-containing protein [Anaerolineae bacterium]|nr:cyclic nucleotide-binding domain-containing protein [Anaerolineae bacterium]
MDVAERLKDYSLFKDVSAKDRQGLIDVMREETYAKNDMVFDRGDDGDSMYIILSGSVRIVTEDADGNPFTIRRLTEMFGEFSVLDKQLRSAAVIADEDLKVLVLHRKDFMEFIRQRPVVGLSMMRNLVERVRYTTIYLQEVMDATHQLVHGEYEELQDLSASSTEAEIQKLIQAFIDMAQSVQTRERTLQRALDE